MPQSNPRSRNATRSAAARPASARPSTTYQPTRATRSAQAGGRGSAGYTRSTVSSVRLGDLENGRGARMQSRYKRHVRRIFTTLAILAVAVAAYAVLYFSSAFTITEVTVKGCEHLTDAEMTELAAVPTDTTLLRVDAAGITSRLQSEPWVASASVNRVLPSTLELDITERTIKAVVQVPTKDASKYEKWAIASDGMWLMKIPDENSAEAANVSKKVYEDAAEVLQITDVPYGVEPKVGTYCTDDNVNNALKIISGMTTELAGQVKRVSANGTETTTLTLENGVQIAFGDANDIRDKERICLQLMSAHEGEIAYINVRTPSRPTWRAVS